MQAIGTLTTPAATARGTISGAVIPGVLRGRDLLCFSHDWNGDPLSKNHLMRILARDNRVLWVNSIGNRTPTASKADLTRALNKLLAAANPIKEVEKNLFVLNPLAIPAYGKASVRAFNRHFLRWQVKRAMRQLKFARPINFVFNPAAAIIAGELNEERLIYYCVDEYTAFTGVASRPLAEMEEGLCRKSDLVIVSADKLYDTKARFNPHTRLIRHGVDYAHFSKALDPATAVPDEIANLPRPVIGFHGLIADWVDVKLLAHIARTFNEGSLVLIGKVTTDVSSLAPLPNVHLLGRKPYAELPAYCKGFDVALNPFQISELTLNANPLKVREYLAAGLPVVSTSVPEVMQMKCCHIGSTHDAFVQEINRALEYPGPNALRSETMRVESWEARVEEIRGYFAQIAGCS